MKRKISFLLPYLKFYYVGQPIGSLRESTKAGTPHYLERDFVIKDLALQVCDDGLTRLRYLVVKQVRADSPL